MVHIKSRQQHPKYSTARIEVPDKYVSWIQPFDYYTENRAWYTHPDVEKNLLLEDNDPKRWTESPQVSDTERVKLDNRITYINGYAQTLKKANIIFDEDNLPANPMGRTGMTGPGLLGKNGPNQAADPIFTRWSPFNMKPLTEAVNNLKPIFTSNYIKFNIFELIWEVIKALLLLFPHLEMIAIKRRDTGDWAIPGGMVEAGETVSQTLRNEINQEACNNMNPDNASKEIDKIFEKSKGKTIYRGYVDDPRNTDCRWLETTAVHFHCDTVLASAIKLNAGDDAAKVTWLAMSLFEPRYRNLYASHRSMTDKAMFSMMIPYYVYNILLPITVFKITNVLLALI
jgi:8-oxo-dGTP pyrophosphatase MutT (NUDIX family)